MRTKPPELPEAGTPAPITVGPAWNRFTNAISATPGCEKLAEARRGDLGNYLSASPGARISIDLGELMLDEGLRGDQGAMEHSLKRLQLRLQGTDPLSASERYGLLYVLARIADSAQGVQVAAGVENRRGGSKKGDKSLEIAAEVLGQLTHGTATSFEDAWAAVAAKRHVSEGLVRKYWMERKSVVLQVIKQPPEISAAQIVEQSVRAGFR